MEATPGIQTVVWKLKQDIVEVHYDGTTIRPDQIGEIIEGAESGFRATKQP